MICYDNDKKDLNIEHRCVSIVRCENHDTGNNTMALVLMWVFGCTNGSAE